MLLPAVLWEAKIVRNKLRNVMRIFSIIMTALDNNTGEKYKRIKEKTNFFFAEL